MTGMAIGISPQRLREVRFAEQWRGYRTEEVDEFVEQVADAFDVLAARLHDASERAARAEARLLERDPEDDLSRTLVLAQRTADAALREAEVESARLLADSEERARTIMADVEGRAARLDAEIHARAEAELQGLAEHRRALEGEVELLASYVDQERERLADDLRQRLAWLEDSDHLDPGWLVHHLSPRPVDVASGSRPEAGGPAGPAPPDPGAPFGTAADDPVALAEAAPAVAVPTEVAPGAEPDIVAPVSMVEASAPDPVADDPPAPGEMASSRPGLEDEGSPGPDGPLLPGGAVDGLGPESTTVAQAERQRGEPAGDDDPFIAELRRAVDDPEPLGPRDPTGEWEGDRINRDRSSTSSGRFRRRRQR